MKNLFLLLVVIIFFSVLTEVKKAEKINVMHLEKSQVVDFSGTLFLPQNIQLGEEEVKPKELIISVAGKKYRYRRSLQLGYELEGKARELAVSPGDRVEIKGTDLVKLFFAREV